MARLVSRSVCLGNGTCIFPSQEPFDGGVVVDTVKWVIEKGKCLAALIQKILGVAEPLAQGNTPRVAEEVTGALRLGFPQLLGLLFAQFKIDKVTSYVKRALNAITKRIMDLIKTIVDKILGKSKEPKRPGSSCVKCKPGPGMAKPLPSSPRLGLPCGGGQGQGQGKGKGQCLRAGTPIWRGDGTGTSAAVESVRLGERVATWLPGEPGYGDGATEGVFDPPSYQAVWLVREEESGRREVGLLRSEDWLSARGIARAGDWCELDLPELGAAGRYQVLAVEACPAVEVGPGRLVTGVFRFERGEVYELLVGGEAVGMTARHPVWSVDRDE